MVMFPHAHSVFDKSWASWDISEWTPADSQSRTCCPLRVSEEAFRYEGVFRHEPYARP